MLRTIKLKHCKRWCHLSSSWKHPRFSAITQLYLEGRESRASSIFPPNFVWVLIVLKLKSGLVFLINQSNSGKRVNISPELTSSHSSTWKRSSEKYGMLCLSYLLWTFFFPCGMAPEFGDHELAGKPWAYVIESFLNDRKLNHVFSVKWHTHWFHLQLVHVPHKCEGTKDPEYPQYCIAQWHWNVMWRKKGER